MSTITLPNIRVSSDLTVKVRLKDGGVAIDWSTLSNIRALIYADAQRAMAGRCAVSIDAEDATLLVCQYAANKPQYIGVNRIVISATYMGEMKTYDKPALNFVRWTDDQAGQEITIDDPDVEVEIEVEDVSSSILQEAIAAALQAAEDAEHAAHLIPNQILLDCEAATQAAGTATGEANAAAEAANAAAGRAPYIDETTGNWFVWDVETGQYVDSGEEAQGPQGNPGPTPNLTIGTVETGAAGSQAEATITGTAANPVLNLRIPQGVPGVVQAKYVEVDTLPTASASTMNALYLVPSQVQLGTYDIYYTSQDGRETYSWVFLCGTAIQLSDYATKDELTQLEAKVGNPVLSFVGNGATYASGVSSDGILLKNHNYRFYLQGYDLSGLSLSNGQAVATMVGTGEDGTSVSAFRINRGTGTFVLPKYVEYRPNQNVYGLRFDGRNKSGTTAKLVIEDLGETEYPFRLELKGDGTTYASSPYQFTLYPGQYRCNIVQWDVTGLSFGGAKLGLFGTDGEGNSVTIFSFAYADTLPAYKDFTVSSTVYNVYIAGRVKSGEYGIVTVFPFPDVSALITDIINSVTPTINGTVDDKIEQAILFKNIPLEQGKYDATGTVWATDETAATNRLRSDVMKADDVFVEVPDGLLMMAHYGTPGNAPSGSIPYSSGYIRITKSMGSVRFLLRSRSGGTVLPSDYDSPSVTPFPDVLALNSRSLDFPVMGCGSKMLSLPRSTYAHLPNVRETSKFIFVLYTSSVVNTTETVGQNNEITLCVISKASGEQWYETLYNGFEPDIIDGNPCEYCHTVNMIDVADDTVVVTTGCVNNAKFLFVNKTYNATSRTIGNMEKSTISYGGNTYDLNLRNYIQMANSVYSLSITESDKVANSADIWNPSKYDDNGTTKYIALFSFKASSADATPYIMMTSEDGKDWAPMFLLNDDLKPGESQAIVEDGKIYLTNRIGGSTSDAPEHGQFYGVCDMSGNFLKSWTKLNVQRTRPCEVVVEGVVYIIYNDGTNSGRYRSRRKIVFSKVNSDYSITDIKTYFCPHGVHYQSACNYNGAILMAYVEDRRGYISGSSNPTTDIAIAQIIPEN